MYSAMVFKLLINICDKIDIIFNRFLCSGDKEKRKITLVNWNTVCMENGKGGLGMRKMKHVSRQALRGKLV